MWSLRINLEMLKKNAAGGILPHYSGLLPFCTFQPSRGCVHDGSQKWCPVERKPPDAGTRPHGRRWIGPHAKNRRLPTREIKSFYGFGLALQHLIPKTSQLNGNPSYAGNTWFLYSLDPISIILMKRDPTFKQKVNKIEELCFKHQMKILLLARNSLI